MPLVRFMLTAAVQCQVLDCGFICFSHSSFLSVMPQNALQKYAGQTKWKVLDYSLDIVRICGFKYGLLSILMQILRLFLFFGNSALQMSKPLPWCT